VHLDERGPGEGVEVGEPDDEGGKVRQGQPGAGFDLLEPLAGDLVVRLGLLDEDSLRGSRRSRIRDASTGITSEAESECPSRQAGSVCPPNSSRRSRTNRSHISS
jgi:hypothetical protein